MAATRRERLAAVIGDDEFPGLDFSGEADNPEAEAGFPFELLSGSRPGLTDNTPPVSSRVKTSEEKKEKESPRKPPRGTATERQLAEIGEALTEKAAQVAMLTSGLLPVTSVYGAENSDKAVNALLAIAKRRPKFLAALTKAADTIDALELAKFFIGLAVAFQVDMGRMTGDEMAARASGVTAIIEEFFQTEPDGKVNPAMEIQVPRFATV